MNCENSGNSYRGNGFGLPAIKNVLNGQGDQDSACSNSICDYNYIRYIGWQEPDQCIKSFFSQKTIDTISKVVTQLTMGVDLQNRKIVVPTTLICRVMDAVYTNYQPPVGDIFTRYVIPKEPADENMIKTMIDQTIEIIVNDIRSHTAMDLANSKLTAWVQVMGDFNPNGLRQHPPIKLQEKRPATMQFNMNY